MQSLLPTFRGGWSVIFFYLGLEHNILGGGWKKLWGESEKTGASGSTEATCVGLVGVWGLRPPHMTHRHNWDKWVWGIWCIRASVASIHTLLTHTHNRFLEESLKGGYWSLQWPRRLHIRYAHSHGYVGARERGVWRLIKHSLRVHFTHITPKTTPLVTSGQEVAKTLRRLFRAPKLRPKVHPP